MIEKYVDAEELKRLVSTLLVVVGALLIAALFASIVVPGIRNANRPAAPTPVKPVVGEPGWLDPAEFPPEKGREIPPVDPAALIAPSPELLARGKQVYAPNCVACHGESGKGDGTAASTMKPAPRSFSQPQGWTNGSDLAAIFKTLSEGIPGTSMTAFDYLAKRDRMALAHYVQSLGAFTHPASSRESMDALSKNLAAPGEKTSNKIPVSMAIRKLEQQFSAPPPIVIPSRDPSAEARILRRVITDGTRAAQTLTGSSIWRTGPQGLANAIISGAPANGFSTGAATLNPAEWQELHSGLLRIYPQ
jgi:mono/diheme cytochrome c family protein